MANEDLLHDVSFRGGSRVGWVNATWPLARLVANRRKLTLGSLGSYEFTPEQVVSFGTYGSIPFLANGLAIVHNRLDYPARMVFWCAGSRARVLEEIRRVGFVPVGIAVERPRGMPFRWSFAIGAILAWNLLFLADSQGVSQAAAGSNPGPGSVAAFAMAFVLATAVKASARTQRLALAPGHAVGEVRAFLTLLQLVSGPIALAFGASVLLTR